MTEHNSITIKHMSETEIGILIYSSNIIIIYCFKLLTKCLSKKYSPLKLETTVMLLPTVNQQVLKFIAPKVLKNILLIIRDFKTNNAFQPIPLNS